MPSLTPDPNDALVRKIQSLESRLAALETRRVARRAWAYMTRNSGSTYSDGVETTIDWDSTTSKYDGFTESAGTITPAYGGDYLMVYQSPTVTTQRGVTVRLETTGDVLVESNAMTWLTASRPVFVAIVTLTAGTGYRLTVQASGGSAVPVNAQRLTLVQLNG